MLELIFSLDYEIYGNGDGDVRELVLEPAARLMDICEEQGARLSLFFEAAEFLRLRETVPAVVREVETQIREAHRRGHDVQLHLHPQWFNARYRTGRWEPDFQEYNLARLDRDKIRSYISAGKSYLEDCIADRAYCCHTFRGGNWLVQPSGRLLSVLAELAFRYESSVFRGGLDRTLGLDFRTAASPVYSWRIAREDINRCDPQGSVIELPIFTRQVPLITMLSGKRLRLQQLSNQHKKTLPAALDGPGNRPGRRRLRWRYPKKFDFCRMTLGELTAFLKHLLKEYDLPGQRIPVVLVGHTKDFVDDGVLREFLILIKENYANRVYFQTYAGLSDFYVLPHG